MPKRVYRNIDEERTGLLGQDELFVQKKRGNDDYFITWNQDPEVDTCPRCNGEVVKIQDLFSKKYYDIIKDGVREKVISVEYEFYKWRCLNKECRHIFPKKIDFASRNDNVTYRLENRIAELVMNGYSYGRISSLFQHSISRQAIGQIFYRWVIKKEEIKKAQKPPTRIAILSGKTDRDRYTILLNLDDEDIKVYDIALGVNFTDISAMIKKLDATSVQMVISDCNETINSAIKDNLPNVLHIIPVDYWFKLVENDFAEFSHNKLKWCNVSKKYDVILTPQSNLGLRIHNLEKILSDRPAIKQPYEDFNKLRNIISRRDELWVYDELIEWTKSVDNSFKEQLTVTVMQLHTYKKEIDAHVQNIDSVPEQLFALTSRLEKAISNQRTFSNKALRARVLYSVETDLNNWSGVPIERVIESVEKMIESGGKRNEYQ